MTENRHELEKFLLDYATDEHGCLFPIWSRRENRSQMRHREKLTIKETELRIKMDYTNITQDPQKMVGFGFYQSRNSFLIGVSSGRAYGLDYSFPLKSSKA